MGPRGEQGGEGFPAGAMTAVDGFSLPAASAEGSWEVNSLISLFSFPPPSHWYSTMAKPNGRQRARMLADLDWEVRAGCRRVEVGCEWKDGEYPIHVIIFVMLNFSQLGDLPLPSLHSS